LGFKSYIIYYEKKNINKRKQELGGGSLKLRRACGGMSGDSLRNFLIFLVTFFIKEKSDKS